MLKESKIPSLKDKILDSIKEKQEESTKVDASPKEKKKKIKK
jgi:hypothetical protein